MYFLIVIGIIVLIIYFNRDKFMRAKNTMTGERGLCVECKHCRLANGRYFCAIARAGDISPKSEMPCCEHVLIDDELIEDVIFSAIDLNYDGKHYVRQKLHGRKFSVGEVDSIIKNIASDHPEFLSSYRPSAATHNVTSRPTTSTQPKTTQPQPVAEKPKTSIPLSYESSKTIQEIKEDIRKVSEDPQLLETFKTDGESGDAEAAFVVAMHYREKEKYFDAYKWSCMSADKGFFRGIALAVELSPIAARVSQKVAGSEEALPLYEKGMMYFETAQNHPEAAAYPQLIKQLDESFCSHIVEGMGACLLNLKRYAEAKDVLLKRERQGKSTNELSVLLGYAYFFLDEDKEAYSHLRVIERADRLEIDHQFIEAAYEFLALFYREAPEITGIVGKQNGAEAAYRLISRAAAQPDEVGQWGREELTRYHKNQFGSYDYI